MGTTELVTLLLSFIVGVGSSIAATWLIFLRRRSRYRLKFRSVLALLEDLMDEVTKDGFRYDQILALGRNSGVVGSIIAGMSGLGAATCISMQKTRTPDGGRTLTLSALDERILSELDGLRVLVVICCNDSGASLGHVVERLNELDLPPCEVKTLALYTAPSPLFKPHYSGVVVGHDTKKTMSEILEGLPWVSQKWIHPFLSERTTRSTPP